MSRLHINKQYLNADWTVEKARDELNNGLNLLSKIDAKIVTFFGSHRVNQKSKYYQDCKKLAFELGKRGYAILLAGAVEHAAHDVAKMAHQSFTVRDTEAS